MNNKIRTDAVDHLFDAILTLKDKEEFYIFFEDVCTVNEKIKRNFIFSLRMFAQ